MTDKKISELTNITGANVDDTADELAIVDASTNTTNAITREELFKGIDGNVGIGTSTPAHQFEVENSGGSAIIAATSSVTGTSQLRLGDTNNTGAGRINYDNSTNAMGLAAAGTERMRIDSSGNVGIGTSSPAAKLDVNGDAEINGLTVGRGAGDEVSNTAIGLEALEANTTGASNTAVGSNSLRNCDATSNSTGIGTNSLNNVTSGQGNSALGSGSGSTLTTGSRNIIIGVASQPSSAAGSDQVVMGHALTGKGNDTAFIGGTNGAYNEKNVTTWETTSDERIKKNITDNDDGLSVLSQIKVRNFEYRKSDEITDLPSHVAIEQEGVQLGVIAQELQQVLPECVNENSTGVLSVNTDPLIWYLINAVKELKAEIAELKGK